MKRKKWSILSEDVKEKNKQKMNSANSFNGTFDLTFPFVGRQTIEIFQSYITINLFLPLSFSLLCNRIPTQPRLIFQTTVFGSTHTYIHTQGHTFILMSTCFESSLETGDETFCSFLNLISLRGILK